jgi:hypothetical protein
MEQIEDLTKYVSASLLAFIFLRNASKLKSKLYFEWQILNLTGKAKELS